MIKKILKYVGAIVLFLLAWWIGSMMLASPLVVNTTSNQLSPSFTTKDFINMTEEDFNKIKEKEIMKMIEDTAKAYGIKPYTFCGLSWHESSKFKYYNQRIKDSNGRWSYGLFMNQLETALLYDKSATEAKLLNPAYNTHIAAVIFTHNLTKYGSYEMAIAAHNAGTIYNKKITNPDFVKKVYAATGEVYAAYDL